MYLYLDLNKAVGQVSTTATEAKPGREARRAYLESFDEDYSSGVLSGHSSPDDPNHGSSWTSGPTVESELDKVREEDNARDQEQHLVPEDKDQDKEQQAQPQPPQGGQPPVQKSLEVLSLVKAYISDHVKGMLPTEDERSFLLSKGFPKDKIDLGLIKIVGPMRHEFDLWLQNSLQKSIKSLLETV